MVRAVLFDLDDTLFDHRQCARAALAELHRMHDVFQLHPFAEFERMHATLLEELHGRVLAGELPLDAARQERFRRLFRASGVDPAGEIVARAAEAYRDGYQRIRQPVPGAARLLDAVKQHALVGIVSNNLLEEQRAKLRHCALDRFVDALVVSEEAGVSKPNPRIFEIALDRLGCGADEAVMVGDSWAADVIGASDAGIRPVWFNPSGRQPPDPAAAVQEIRALEPVEAALAAILGEHVPAEQAASGRVRRRDTEACE